MASETIAKVLPAWGPGLLGDKAYSVMFDNSKIKRLAPGWAATIPFAEGARQIIDWYDGQTDRQVVDEGVSKAFDLMAEQYS